MKTTSKKPLTVEGLKKLIRQEASNFKNEAKFGKVEDVEDRAKDTDEIEADEYADTLDKHIDMVSALKIEEARLARRLTVVKESIQKHTSAIKKVARKGK